jgi:hypothetical protein
MSPTLSQWSGRASRAAHRGVRQTHQGMWRRQPGYALTLQHQASLRTRPGGLTAKVNGPSRKFLLRHQGGLSWSFLTVALSWL